MRNDVAALYVDPRGPYPKLLELWYDEKRDATRYDGSLPVVAHAPRGPWSRLAALNKYQKPEHAWHALETVRRVGGVFEHPAQSRFFKAAGLPAPLCRDAFGGLTLEVEQVNWGHVARKRTWLYIVGLPEGFTITMPAGGREPTHWCSGGRVQANGKLRTIVPPGIKVCSQEQRRRTPIAFAEWLIDLASKCSTKEA